MDLAELGIVYISEGADAAIAKSQEYHEAVVQVIASEEDRVKAANKVVSATEALSAQITRSIVSYKNSQAAQYEFQAIVLGTNAQLSAQIELLKTMEEMEHEASKAFKETADAARREQGALIDLAKDIEYLNKVRAKEAQEAEAARSKELASREAYYSKIVADAKTAEQAITDAKHKAIVDQQNERDRLVAMYTKEEQERVKAADKSAKETAAINKKSADDAVKDAERKALGEMSWAGKSRDEQLRIKREIASYKAAGISDKTVESTFGAAATTGVVKEVDNLAEKWGKVTLNTSRARSEMVVLAHEAVQGRFSRIPASLMVFAEYTDVTALALSGLGLALMASAAALAVVSIAMVKGLLEQRDLQNALIMTGNYAGTTEGALNAMAHTSVRLGGSLSTAKGIILDLASTGKFTASQIELATTAIVAMEHATGGGEETVKSLTDAFKSLQVEINAHSRYSDELTKAVIKLDSQYHFLTTSTLAQIRALEDEGRTKEASKLATEEFARVTKDRADQIVANLGSIERGWRHVKEAIGEAWSAMRDWGKTDTPQARLQNASAELARVTGPNRMASWGSILGGKSKEETAALDEHRAALKEVLAVQKDAEQEGERVRKQTEANVAFGRIETDYIQVKADKLGIYAQKIEQVRQNLATTLASPTISKADADSVTAKAEATIKKYEEDAAKAAKGKAPKEVSTIDLNAQIQVQNDAYSSAVEFANKKAALERKTYATTKQVENDRFAMVRSNTAAENELGITNVQEYVSHYETLKAAAEQSAANQHELDAKKLQAGKEHLDSVVALQNSLNRVTENGEATRIAAIAKANSEYRALVKTLKTSAETIDQNKSDELEKAASETLKLENAELNKSIEAITKKIAKENEHILSLTLSKEQIAQRAAVEDEAFGKKLENQLSKARFLREQEQGDAAKIKMYKLEIETLQSLINLRKTSKANQEEIAVAQVASDRAKAIAAEWKKGWEETNKLGMDVFTNWGMQGESMAKKIGDMLKKALLEAIYVATLKPVLFKIYTSFAGGGSMAGAEALGGMAGSANNMLGNAATLGKMYDTITGGFTKLTASVSGSLQGAADWMMTSSSDMVASMGETLSANVGTLSSVAGYAAGAAAGIVIGNAISGDFGSSGTVMVGTAIGAIWGPLGAAIGGAVGGLLNRAFGMGNVETVAQGTRGTFSGSSFSGNNYSQMHQDGGWFRSDKDWTVNTALDQNTTDSWSSAFSGMKQASKDLAQTLGLATAGIDSYSKVIDVAAGTTKEQLTALFLGMANDMATAAAPNIASFAKVGEASSVTLSRLSTSLTTANAWLAMLRNRLFDVSLAGADSASKLTDLFGSMENFSAATKAYYDAYYSDAEKVKQTYVDVAKAMALINEAMPTTKEGFRDIVNGLDLTTDSGRAAYKVLMAVAPEFANTIDALAKAATELAKTTSEKLLATFTTKDIVPALDKISLSIGGATTASDYLTKSLSFTNSEMGNANSAVLSFNTSSVASAKTLDTTQKSVYGLNSEIDILKTRSGDAVLNLAGLSEALKGVTTETFVMTLNGIFTNLAAHTKSVFEDVTAERISVREAAISIMSPQIYTKTQIEDGIKKAQIGMPTKTGIDTSYAAQVKTSGAYDKAYSESQTAHSWLTDVTTTNNAKITAAQTKVTDTTKFYKDKVAGFTNLMNAYGVWAWGTNGKAAYEFNDATNRTNNFSNWNATTRNDPKKDPGYFDYTATLNGANKVLAATEVALASAKTAAAKAIAPYQTTVNTKDAALVKAQAARDLADAASKKAILDYTKAMQTYTLDAGKATAQLGRLKDETVKYYTEQKRLAELMSASSGAIRETVANYRYSQMSESDQVTKLKTDFGVGYSAAMSSNGEVLSGYGDKLNGMIGPLIEKLTAAGQTQYIESYIAQLEAVAKKIEDTTPINYQADSLKMLNDIDSSLKALEDGTASATEILRKAIDATTNATAVGLRAVVTQLGGTPAFATGGDFGGGLRLVGENGPELEVTGPSRIFNASQTRSIFSGGGSNNNGEVVNAIRELKTELSNLRIETRATASNTSKLAKLADRTYNEDNTY